MTLDAIQAQAAECIYDWFTKHTAEKQTFTLSGRAGTGKSTIVTYVINRLGLASSDVAFTAPTGKAAMVMKEKGMNTACTIHSLIYIPKEEAIKKKLSVNMPSIDEIIEAAKAGKASDLRDVIKGAKERQREAAGVQFTKRSKLDEDIHLIVCDEASMISDKMMLDIESFKIPVLYIGDHHQLPPVDGRNIKISHPDFELEKIFRQDANGGIVKFSSRIIDERIETIPDYMDDDPEIMIMPFSDFVASFKDVALDFASQILCGTNAIRIAINSKVRKVMGFEKGIPEEGDKLICLRNNYDSGFINGMQCTVEKVLKSSPEQGYMRLDLRAEDGGSFLNTKISLAPFIPELLKDDILYAKCKKCEQFDFGYAITVHKSEGSEWKNVVYIESTFGAGDFVGMHYTAVTRASEKLLIVKAPRRGELSSFIETI